LRDIGDDIDRVGARLTQFGRRLCAFRLVAPGDHHRGPRLRKTVRHAKPDAAIAAGDDGGASRQVEAVHDRLLQPAVSRRPEMTTSAFSPAKPYTRIFRALALPPNSTPAAMPSGSRAVVIIILRMSSSRDSGPNRARQRRC
jgi:hypothetical protein